MKGWGKTFLSFWVVSLSLLSNLSAHASLTLEECYQLALNYSDRVAISKEEIQLAQARFTQALGEVLPQISYQLTEILQDPTGVGGGNAIGQTFTQLSRTTGAFNFRQILFRGLQEYQAIKITRLDQKRTRQDLENVERLLFQDVAVAFYTIALIERDMETDRTIIGVIQDRIKELNRRVQLGKSREGELTQEQTLLALLQADLERRNGNREVAYEMMSFLTGVDPMPPIRPVDPVEAGNRPLDFYIEYIPTRPDLQAAKTEVEIAQQNIKYTRGNFMPRVDLESNVYTFRPGFQSDIRWDTAIFAEVPLFKYQNLGIYKEAKVLAKQSEYEAENLSRIATREVKEAFDNFQSSRNQYQLYQKAVDLAYKNFQYQNQDFILGRATNLDVLTAQRSWLDSLVQRNRSEIQTWLNWTQLQVTSGVMP